MIFGAPLDQNHGGQLEAPLGSSISQLEARVSLDA